ncbi:heat-shock protein [Leptospira perolatii]|uniref:Heat-shock protein n=1 Tax=Leptospira perolatii TaxID=2023191 RepID=A0A2M9ZLA8_9LEPT|nr:Hsp20/alpha crystallin family protein [Leptospira perolatii]PJZ70311.1 heat-shock protein [Leptospira perolatii]PJZ72805.1 heat-shock protein [Leptospira perolatii]
MSTSDLKKQETKAQNISETKSEVTRETTGNKPTYTPSVDIYSNDDRHLLVLDLPGVKEGDLEITLDKDELLIYGKTTLPETTGELRYSEYRPGNFRRSFILSEPVEEENISAVLKNGVLNISLQRKKSQPRKVEIKTTD